VRPRHTARAVLFDLDDTLFDHHGASRRALRVVHAAHDLLQHVPFDEFERAHAAFLEELHVDVIAGTRAIDDARIERFRRLFLAAGVLESDVDLPAVAANYRGAYLGARQAIAGALALLTALKPRVRIGIVTNNLVEEQRDKVARLGFAPYLDALVVSEEAGASKPDPAIFRLALERLDAAAEDAVMVGDSWAADVEGALAARIRPIWFNRLRRPAPRATVAVRQLHALEPIESAIDVILTQAAGGEPGTSDPVSERSDSSHTLP
jgi:putative hydrolase of the HAD superfamily